MSPLCRRQEMQKNKTLAKQSFCKAYPPSSTEKFLVAFILHLLYKNDPHICGIKSKENMHTVIVTLRPSPSLSHLIVIENWKKKQLVPCSRKDDQEGNVNQVNQSVTGGTQYPAPIPFENSLVIGVKIILEEWKYQIWPIDVTTTIFKKWINSLVPWY